MCGGGGQNSGWGVQENENNLEYDEIVDIFFMGGGGVITKMDYFWGSFIYILGHFLNVKVQNWNIFSGLLNVCLIFLIFIGGKQWMLSPSLRIKKKVPHPWES